LVCDMTQKNRKIEARRKKGKKIEKINLKMI
jgi:hypothetical protein